MIIIVEIGNFPSQYVTNVEHCRQLVMNESISLSLKFAAQLLPLR